MPICSYLVFAAEGEAAAVAERLSSLPGCDVVAAENRDVLILVTETDGREAEDALRRDIERTAGVRGLVLTFGELDPAASSDSGEVGSPGRDPFGLPSFTAASHGTSAARES